MTMGDLGQSCGSLADDGRWVAPKRRLTFLLPVRALSKVFEGGFISGLQQARGSGHPPRDPATPAQQCRHPRALLRGA